jgi:hypothetical protein
VVISVLGKDSEFIGIRSAKRVLFSSGPINLCIDLWIDALESQ